MTRQDQTAPEIRGIHYVLVQTELIGAVFLIFEVRSVVTTAATKQIAQLAAVYR